MISHFVFKEQPKNANNQIEMIGLLETFAFQRFRKTFNRPCLLNSKCTSNKIVEK